MCLTNSSTLMRAGSVASFLRVQPSDCRTSQSQITLRVFASMQAGQFVDELPGPANGTPPGSLDSQQVQLAGSYKGKGSALPPLQRADSVKQRTIQVCARVICCMLS